MDKASCLTAGREDRLKQSSKNCEFGTAAVYCQRKRVKIREIEIVCSFIGAFDFEEARERSQTAQDKNNAKAGAV